MSIAGCSAEDVYRVVEVVDDEGGMQSIGSYR